MTVGTEGSLLAGRYRVLRTLGSGGMATVALCEDRNLGRRVAVKRLHAHGDADDQRRFLREARVGAALNHPNLVGVYDTAMDGESVLIVMEHVDGGTLADAIADGPLPPERALRAVRDVASALEHAHAHGIVHRDVKPANILLREDGSAKLADLGIAVAADTTRITQSGTVLGSAAYMAPEQLDGGEAGPPADAYALAAVAYEALSGRRARPGRTPVEVARMVATDPPPDLRDAWPEAPPAVAQALRAAMARDPAARPTPARLAEELERALEDEPTAATSPLAVGRPPAAASPPAAGTTGPLGPPSEPGGARMRSARRRPSPTAAAGVLLGAVAAGALVLALLTGGGASGGEDEPARKSPSAGRSSPGSAGAPGAGARAGGPDPASEAPAGHANATGARLNDRGFALMREGRFEEAVPVLRRAVAAFPRGADDVRYAYALFNLGSALRQSGRPEEAIPILERRLRIPNQTGTVRRELEAARKAAGAGERPKPDKDKGDKGRGRKGDED